MLGLGTVVVGAFDDKIVKKVVGVQPHEHPLYVMPIGNPR
jgi:nitroreductase